MIVEKKMSRVILCLSAFVTFLNFLPFTISSSKKCELNKLLNQNEILKDLELTLPKQCLKTLQVQFPSGLEFLPGSELDLSRIRHQPMILNLHDLVEEDETLTIVMVDPDAPSRQNPKYRQYLHWLVQFNAKSLSFETLMEFMASSPPKGTGKHRYILLAFSQKTTSLNKVIKNPSQRPNFQVAPFISTNHLGNLVGVTFYFAQDE